MGSAKITLRFSPKCLVDGTHRASSPAGTDDMIRRAVANSDLPVLKKTTRIDNLDALGIPVFAVTHDDIFKNWVTPSWGKGATRELARISALMERLERHSASCVPKNRLIYSRFIDLGNSAVSRWDFVPCNLQRMLYSRKQVDSQRAPWAKCFSLTTNKEVLIPANLVYFMPLSELNDFSYTTGLASGNSLEEALFHGLCEVIERHIQEVVYRNRLKAPLIDIKTVDDPLNIELISKFRSNGLRLSLAYLTMGFGIPVIGAFAFSEKGPNLDSYSYYAAIGIHAEKNIALTRALTELAQSRATARYRIKHGFVKIKQVRKIPACIFHFFNDIIDNSKKIGYSDIRSFKNGDFLDDIKLVKRILENKGCQIIVKDLTHPVLRVPTVRVKVKGLQPGIFGVGIIDLAHKAARVSRHLKYHKILVPGLKNKNFSLAGA